MASQTLPLDQVKEHPDNPRQRFDPEALAELADSIREVGLLQPIVVRPLNGHYQVVCGARRFRATQLAGGTEIEAIVRDLDDRAAAHAMIIENNQREDVTPIEEARGFETLRELGEEPKEIAARIGRPHRYVRDRLRLLQLTPELQDFVDVGRLTLGAALIATRISPSLQAKVKHAIERAGEGAVLRERDVRQMLYGWQRNIQNAPWDIEDATLAPEGAGSCSGCPYRSSAQPDLFVNEGCDRCTHDSCWDERMASHWQGVVDQVEAAGGRVVDRKVDAIARDSVGCYVDDKRGWTLLKDLDGVDLDGLTRYLTKSSYAESYEVCYLAEDVATVLDAAGEARFAERVRAIKPTGEHDNDWRLEQKERKKAEKARERKRELALRKVIEAVAAENVDARNVYVRLCRLLVRFGSAETSTKMLSGRGEKKVAAEERQAKALDMIDAVVDVDDEGLVILALLVELVVREAFARSYGELEDWQDLCLIAGVQAPK